MKTVLVTGSAGFMGSNLCDHILKNTDWVIHGLDSFKHRGDAVRVYQSPDRYKVHYSDLSAPISRRLADHIGSVDYIINLASDSHVQRSIDDPVPFWINNTQLIVNVLEYARLVKPKAFFQFGTDESYGPAPRGVDHKEWSPVLPSNPYSASKAAQEAISIAYWRTYGVPLILSNTMNLTGRRQDSEKYLPMLISKIQAGDTVTVHGMEDHIGSRKYLNARSAADAVLFILKQDLNLVYDADSIFPHRFNIVGDVEINNLELAEMVADILKKPLKYEFLDFHSVRKGHDFRYSLDGSKLASMGWSAPISFRDSLEQTIEWTLENKIWLK